MKKASTSTQVKADVHYSEYEMSHLSREVQKTPIKSSCYFVNKKVFLKKENPVVEEKLLAKVIKDTSKVTVTISSTIISCMQTYRTPIFMVKGISKHHGRINNYAIYYPKQPGNTNLYFNPDLINFFYDIKIEEKNLRPCQLIHCNREKESGGLSQVVLILLKPVLDNKLPDYKSIAAPNHDWSIGYDDFEN